MVLKKTSETPLDRTLAKVQKYLGDNALIAVPFDKGINFVLWKRARTQKNWKKY